MGRPFTTKDSLLSLMSDGKPRSTREVTERLGVTARAAESACCRYWKAGLLLRSEKPLLEANRVFAGRAGTAFNPKDEVKVGSEVLSVAQYAARMSIQLLKASDLNEMLHKRGIQVCDRAEGLHKITERGRSQRDTRQDLESARKHSRAD